MRLRQDQRAEDRVAPGQAIRRGSRRVPRKGRYRRPRHRRRSLLQAAREMVLLVRLLAGVLEGREESEGAVGENISLKPQGQQNWLVPGRSADNRQLFLAFFSFPGNWP